MGERKIIGIDLAGKPDRRTGLCILAETLGQTETRAKTIYTDEELLAEIDAVNPVLVAIDAPLTEKKEDRKADEELRSYGALSLKLPGMQMLAKRGRWLAKELSARKIPAIEVFPRATEKIMGLDRAELSRSRHQADAIIAAITGYLHIQGKTREVGGRDGKVVIPKPGRRSVRKAR